MFTLSRLFILIKSRISGIVVCLIGVLCCVGVGTIHAEPGFQFSEHTCIRLYFFSEVITAQNCRTLVHGQALYVTDKLWFEDNGDTGILKRTTKLAQEGDTICDFSRIMPAYYDPHYFTAGGGAWATGAGVYTSWDTNGNSFMQGESPQGKIGWKTITASEIHSGSAKCIPCENEYQSKIHECGDVKNIINWNDFTCTGECNQCDQQCKDLNSGPPECHL